MSTDVHVIKLVGIKKNSSKMMKQLFIQESVLRWWETQRPYLGIRARAELTRPSALGMSDPGVEPLEILEILELETLPYPCPPCCRRLVR